MRPRLPIVTGAAAALPRWLHVDNVQRPHTALAGQPPITRLTMNNLLGHDS
jgi:hypothetical protein